MQLTQRFGCGRRPTSIRRQHSSSVFDVQRSRFSVKRTPAEESGEQSPTASYIVLTYRLRLEDRMFIGFRGPPLTRPSPRLLRRFGPNPAEATAARMTRAGESRSGTSRTDARTRSDVVRKRLEGVRSFLCQPSFVDVSFRRPMCLLRTEPCLRGPGWPSRAAPVRTPRVTTHGRLGPSFPARCGWRVTCTSFSLAFHLIRRWFPPKITGFETRTSFRTTTPRQGPAIVLMAR